MPSKIRGITRGRLLVSKIGLRVRGSKVAPITRVCVELPADELLDAEELGADALELLPDEEEDDEVAVEPAVVVDFG